MNKVLIKSLYKKQNMLLEKAANTRRAARKLTEDAESLTKEIGAETYGLPGQNVVVKWSNGKLFSAVIRRFERSILDGNVYAIAQFTGGEKVMDKMEFHINHVSQIVKLVK